MRLRDQSASAYQSVFILKGLRPEVVAAVPAAVRRLVADRDARPLRRRWTGFAGRSSHLSVRLAESLADAHVLALDPDLSDEDVYALHCRTEFVALPFNVLVGGDRVSVKTWHAELDGFWTLELLHRLVEAASGTESPRWPRPAAFPVVRTAVRTIAPLAVLQYLRHQRSHRSPVQWAPPPSREQELREGVRLQAALLTSDLVEQVRRAPGPRTTVNSRLVSAVARTARDVYRGQGDPAVLVPVHLSRWIRGPVNGNFIHSLRIGGLRSADWTPSRVQTAMDAAQGRLGFGGWLWDLQWPLKDRLRGRSAESAVQGELTVQISTIRSPRPFPAHAWLEGRPDVRFGSVGPYPAFFSLLWRMGDDVLLLSEDETDQFDSAAYLSALERHLGSLVGRPGEPVLGARSARS